MDKTIRWNVDPKQQQEETYLYWRGRPIGERLQATFDLSRDLIRFSREFKERMVVHGDGEGPTRHPAGD